MNLVDKIKKLTFLVGVSLLCSSPLVDEQFFEVDSLHQNNSALYQKSHISKKQFYSDLIKIGRASFYEEAFLWFPELELAYEVGEVSYVRLPDTKQVYADTVIYSNYASVSALDWPVIREVLNAHRFDADTVYLAHVHPSKDQFKKIPYSSEVPLPLKNLFTHTYDYSSSVSDFKTVPTPESDVLQVAPAFANLHDKINYTCLGNMVVGGDSLIWTYTPRKRIIDEFEEAEKITSSTGKVVGSKKTPVILGFTVYYDEFKP